MSANTCERTLRNVGCKLNDDERPLSTDLSRPGTPEPLKILTDFLSR